MNFYWESITVNPLGLSKGIPDAEAEYDFYQLNRSLFPGEGNLYQLNWSLFPGAGTFTNLTSPVATQSKAARF